MLLNSSISGISKFILKGQDSIYLNLVGHIVSLATVQLSYPYMTTGKTIALIRQTFVSKVISLLFNTLSRFVIAILPKSKYLLILWLQSPSVLILEHKKMKSDTVSPSIHHEVMGLDAMILVF